jgi:ABC-2 type transport system permease protein
MTGNSMTVSLSVIPEIVRITYRQLLGRRRTLLLLLLAALPILLAVIFRLAVPEHSPKFATNVFDLVSLAVILPLAAVLFGTGAFGAESDDGTILYLLAKPIPRWAIVAAKSFAAATMTIALTVGAVLLAGLIDLVPDGADGVAATQAHVAAMVVGSLCYVALFIPLSIMSRRALVIGIAYTLVWEGALSQLLPGIANLSVRQYALGVADWFFQIHRTPARLSPTTSIILAGVLVVAGMVLATWRLKRFELAGGSD